MSFKKDTSGHPLEYKTIYEYNTHYDYKKMMKKSIILMKNDMMIALTSTQMSFKLTKIIYGWKNAPMI